MSRILKVKPSHASEVIATAYEWLNRTEGVKNKCGDACAFIKDRHPDVEWGMGWFMGNPHNWIMVGDLLIDPTISQFGFARMVAVLGPDDALRSWYEDATEEDLAVM